MGEIPVERSPSDGASGSRSDASSERRSAVVDVEREVTKRAMIEAVTSVVLVVLYMAFSFLRERDPGVVALDRGADDWD